MTEKKVKIIFYARKEDSSKITKQIKDILENWDVIHYEIKDKRRF
jgi:hypothetical protein